MFPHAVELQWLEHLWNHVNMFESGVVRVVEWPTLFPLMFGVQYLN